MKITKTFKSDVIAEFRKKNTRFFENVCVEGKENNSENEIRKLNYLAFRDAFIDYYLTSINYDEIKREDMTIDRVASIINIDFIKIMGILLFPDPAGLVKKAIDMIALMSHLELD